MSAETGWAAGLFEGEGSAHLERGRLRLQLRMTQETSVRRFHAAVGVGTVYGPYANVSAERADGYPRRPIFMWVAVRDAADAVAELLLPHLTSWRSAWPTFSHEKAAA